MEFTVNSFSELLNLDFPRNVYESGCPFVLYGAGCCVNKTGFTFNGTIASSPVPNTFAVTVSGVGQADHYFDNGVLLFGSGVLSGLTMTVKSWIGNVLTPFIPLPSAPAPGDTITLFAGCDRTYPTCVSKFANGAHFGGQPFIPIPDTMLAPIVRNGSGGGK
jgi:uncharacterized phage protein (TIGR02218 family)